jgi:hypothetical protein
MNKRYLPLLACLALTLVAQLALAANPEPPKCRMTVESIARAVEPVTRDVPEQPATLPDGLTPAPLFKAIIGDCCPGNNVANCPPVSGYRVRCDFPQCETGEKSCLYWR